MWLLSIVAAVLALIGPTAARAQAPRARLLEGVHFEPVGDAWDVIVAFNVPVQVRSHAPAERGSSLNIQLLLRLLPGEMAPRESLTAPRGGPVPLETVTYDGASGAFPLLELRFSREVGFEVSQGRDLRSVVVRVQLEKRAGTAPSLAPRPAAAPADARSTTLVSEGRRALTAGEFERAALLLQEVLAQPESELTPEALELLGLARERKGQLAHAKSAYEEYLQRYPDGEGATRVSQRLDALVTARAEPLPPRREAHAERRPARFDLETFGSAYIGYRHQTQRLDELGQETFDSSLFGDLYLDTRWRRTDAIVRAQVVGGYRHQFAKDAGGDETTLSSLFVSFEQPEGGFSGSIGRRSHSSGGVLGRFDGVELGYRGGELWEIGVLAGLPVDSSRWTGLETDRFLGGASIELGSFFDALDVELYGVGQSVHGLLDRAAVGTEIRYFRDGIFAVAIVDYDVHFQSLNLAQLTGSWQVTPETTLTGFVDHRNVPFLTTRNALQGQTGGLDALESLFSSSEIDALAEDRTARATTLSLGISQILRPRLQATFDFSASDFSGTEASGGVEGFEGTGFEFSYLAQLIANDVAVPGDLGVLSLRFYDGSRSDVVSAGLQARAPVTNAFRLNPRFYTIYQKSSATQDVVALRPSLRFDYRVWKLGFDAEGGVEWSKALGGGADPPWSWFVLGGIRYDF